MKRLLARLLLVSIAGLVAGTLPAAAQSDDPATSSSPSGYADGYGAGTYGRIRYVEPGVTILRSDTTDDVDRVGAAGVNDAIFPGDSVRTDVDARAEVQLAGGTLVRIDRGTDVSFLSLPDPYASVEDNTILDVTFGVIQISAIVKDRQELRIDTPSASVYLLGDGDFRIEVAGDGTTRVLSRRGVAEVTGAGASVLVRGGTRSVVEPGASPEDARPFHTFASDSFDAWVASRSSAYGRGDSSASADVDAYDQVPAEVRPYYRELSGYGHWVNLPTYGYAWYPSGGGPGWRPYLSGGWTYGPGGYFWVSSEPWGWAPYHYGRWSWVSGYGWCWLPGSVFGGAWVSWSWGASHVGWCALDYWNRPSYYGHGHHHAASWTFVGYSHLGSRDCRRYAVPVDRAGALLQTSAVVTRPPRVSPRVLVGDPSARQRVVNELAANRGARVVADGARQARPDRSFADVERQVLRPKQRPTTVAPGGTPRAAARGRQTVPVGRAPIGRSGSGNAASEQERVRVSDRGSSRPPTDRIRDPGPAETAPQPQRRAAGRDSSGARPGVAPPVVPQPREGQAANEHVREMYRRVAGPRVTGERRRTPAPPTATPRQAPAPAPAPAPPPAAAAPSRTPAPERARPAPQKHSAGGTRDRQGRGGKKK